MIADYASDIWAQHLPGLIQELMVVSSKYTILTP
jgi:hypothetical protein